MINFVPLIPQTSRFSCWAASIAMIRSWKTRAPISDVMVAQNAGGLNYMPSYGKGLDANDKYILEANGFQIEPPLCYTQKRITSLINMHGPLWVATWAPGAHVRVVTGMNGNTLFINDPAPVNQGSVYTCLFDDFFGAMENLGTRELNEQSPVYVAYLR
jgi:hypothetical protein